VLRVLLPGNGAFAKGIAAWHIFVLPTSTMTCPHIPFNAHDQPINHL
jgi:hypothetical protein